MLVISTNYNIFRPLNMCVTFACYTAAPPNPIPTGIAR